MFIQHGLTADSGCWFHSGAKSIPFILAEKGFNVFLGNNRGARYSRKHKTLDPTRDPKKYFDYSFYELGKYDAPAQIDFVRQLTGKDKIGYIGHSQGTTQMFSALSLNHGDLNSKINSFIALAPVASFRFQASREESDGLRIALERAVEITEEWGMYELGPSLVVHKMA